MLAAWYHTILWTLFVVTCILLILVVLLQKGRGGGLGAAFGGAATSAFGTRTGDMFTWVTIVLTAAFLLLAVGTTLVFRPEITEIPPPTFSPVPPGEIGKENYVTLETDIVGANIYYSIDGSEEMVYQQRQQRQGKPVAVPAGSTIEAWAEREGWGRSETVKATYGVEETAEDEIPIAPVDDQPALESPEPPATENDVSQPQD